MTSAHPTPDVRTGGELLGHRRAHLEPGEIRLATVLSREDLPATATSHLTGPARRPGRGRTLTTEITRA